MAQLIKDQILGRIERWGRGKSFVPKDFLDIASRGSIDMALANLTREGTIRRVRRGLYDMPKVSASLGGELSPDIDEAARALARRFSWKIVPEGAWAANLLGLSTQVPSKIVYLSDGPNKKVQIGRRAIQFKHARPQALASGVGKAALIVQALRHLGQEEVDDRIKSKLRKLLSDSEVRQLIKTTLHGVEWIHEVAKEFAKERQ
jgi:hypothetical protein